MTIAEFIEQLKQYPQDVKVFCSPPDYDLEEVVLAEVIRYGPYWWSINPDGSTPHNVIATFNIRSREIIWTDPKAFKTTGEQS